MRAGFGLCRYAFVCHIRSPVKADVAREWLEPLSQTSRIGGSFFLGLFFYSIEQVEHEPPRLGVVAFRSLAFRRACLA